MGETGALAPDARVELIDGEIVDMPPIGSVHAGIVNQLNRMLGQAVGDTAVVGVRNPVELSNRSEPEPDLTLLRPRDDFYKRAHPRPADVLLVIEVADSSLAWDHDVKRPLYARHGIPEVWIVDVGGGRLLTFAEPTDDGYARVSRRSDLSAVPVSMLDGLQVNLSTLFDR